MPTQGVELRSHGPLRASSWNSDCKIRWRRVAAQRRAANSSTVVHEEKDAGKKGRRHYIHIRAEYCRFRYKRYKRTRVAFICILDDGGTRALLRLRLRLRPKNAAQLHLTTA